MKTPSHQLHRDTAILRTATVTALLTALLVAGGMYGWHLSVIDQATERNATADFTALQATVDSLQARLAQVANDTSFATSTYQAVLQTLPVTVRCAYVDIASLDEPAYQLQRPLFADTDDARLALFEAALAAGPIAEAVRLEYLCTDGVTYGFLGRGQATDDPQVIGVWTDGRAIVTATSAERDYLPAGFAADSAGNALFLLQTADGETVTVTALDAASGTLKTFD